MNQNQILSFTTKSKHNIRIPVEPLLPETHGDGKRHISYQLRPQQLSADGRYFKLEHQKADICRKREVQELRSQVVLIVVKPLVLMQELAVASDSRVKCWCCSSRDQLHCLMYGGIPYDTLITSSLPECGNLIDYCRMESLTVNIFQLVIE